jgi:STE24 endopeptidase
VRPVHGRARADAGDVARRLRTVLLFAAFATFAAGATVTAAPALFGKAPAPARTPTASAPGVPAAAYTLSPEKYEKAVAYSRALYRLHFIAAAWEILLLVALTAVGLAPKFRALAERVSANRFVQALVFVPLFLMVWQILEVPVDAYGHHLSLAYDQSVQGWGSWFWDWWKGHLVGLVIATPLFWLLYGILSRSPRRWWFFFWLAALPVIVFVIFIAPVAIDPLFFHFEPLAGKAPDLVAQIEKVTQRGGLSIPRERMFLMDASRKLKSLNAYVTGFGASKRVVVWDTTLARMTTPQTLFVFGHEMGHYVLRHIPKTIVFVSGVLLVILFLAHLVLGSALPADESRWGIRGLADWASLPVLLLILSVASELCSPVINAFSRAQEHAADVYGLEVIHGLMPDSKRTAAEAFQILGEINLSDPHPGRFVEFWLYSHPPLAERLAFAQSYDPWSKGQSPRYVRGSRTP